jgi:hypothetical protein
MRKGAVGPAIVGGGARGFLLQAEGVLIERCERVAMSGARDGGGAQMSVATAWSAGTPVILTYACSRLHGIGHKPRFYRCCSNIRGI